MIHPITIPGWLSASGPVRMADVRTPAEFEQGHIPGAFNLPLFSNEERVQVGTTYKQVSKEAAILLGFDLTGNKWSGFIRQALEMAPDKKIVLHCWRGGMRSGAMAWALNLYGFDVYLLQGGYKSYRRWTLQQFEKQYPIRVIGGMTGTGKTKIIQQLQVSGQLVIDLEALAQHQGSAYGSLNRLIQPTQEQFENNLGLRLSQLNTARPVWVEDESISIGKRFIPKPFWSQMQKSVLFDLHASPEHRLTNLLEEYGTLDKEFLKECTLRIQKRLGPEQTKHAIAAIAEDRIADFIKLVMVYYDKTYRNGIARRSPGLIFPVSLESRNPVQNAAAVLQLAQDKGESLMKTMY